MKILFSPSETKSLGGNKKTFNKNSFIFEDLYKYREDVITKYQTFINSATQEELKVLFGVKKQDLINYYKDDIFKKDTKKVIQRYCGVAYEYLEYNNLTPNVQSYLDLNVIIFSNLFGPVLAGNEGIPDYKLKQAQTFFNFKIEEFYKKHFSSTLDEYLKNDEILDLRASFYEKFYTINKSYITLKFLKNGKVVSHWAKAYRGIILKNMAINNINSTKELLDMEIENLDIQEIKKIKLKTEVIYKIN